MLGIFLFKNPKNEWHLLIRCLVDIGIVYYEKCRLLYHVYIVLKKNYDLQLFITSDNSQVQFGPIDIEKSIINKFFLMD